MVGIARTLRTESQSVVSSGDNTDPTAAEEAVEVAWRSCYQLGRQSEYHDQIKKLRLLGFAMELCPTENTLDILNTWRRIEADDIEDRKRRSEARALSGRPTGKRKPRPQQRPGAITTTAESLLGGLTGFSRGQDNILGRAAAGLQSFSTRERSSERRSSRDFAQLFQSDVPLTPDIGATARHALARGVGWLIGADEDTHKLQ